ncbi:MAG: isoprenyl transferase [Armatimonadetes bacterium]|nr:isoprenyl transferase [Armatimonadota bacterium]
MIEEVSTVTTSVTLDPDRIPLHVAIIMDGNGRWARRRNMSRLEGHTVGYATLRRVVQDSQQLGIKYLTVYGFSSENWRRPKEERDGLMQIMERAMRAEIDFLMKENVRVRISGRLSDLPQSLQREFTSAMDRTRQNTGLNFILAINYGGRAEILDAVKILMKKVRDGELDPENLSEADISACLYEPNIPDPDLLIRTAGEMRLSNFLLWETAYSEIWVTSTPWPDFSRAELEEAIADYQRRTRRFGRVVEADGPNE